MHLLSFNVANVTLTAINIGSINKRNEGNFFYATIYSYAHRQVYGYAAEVSRKIYAFIIC